MNPPGIDNVGNAVLWKFQATNPMVLRWLNAEERGRVTQWQADTLPFRFEFHDGHDIGEPIYIRVNGNMDNANVPKVDTKTATSAHFDKDLKSVKNHEKLTGKGGLSTGDQATLRNLLRTQIAVLKLIAHRKWNNINPPPDPVAPAATRPCTATAACAGVVDNTPGKNSCSVCYLFS